MKASKYKVEYNILIPLIAFAIISIITIYSADSILPSSLNNLALKQGLWFIIGFILAYAIMSIGNDYIYRYSFALYIIGIISLIALLLFAPTINNAKCWFSIPGIGTIQPSEFMKVILIITIAGVINKHNEKYSNHNMKKDFLLISKVFGLIIIPSILTFLQPDTGIVIIYFIIGIVMLFVSGISGKWFLIFGGFIFVVLSIFLSIYFLDSDLFIKIFGTNFFYRIDRILAWKDGVGMQLENATTAIGSAGLFGFGIKNIPIYFPEAHTDFIFSVYASTFGFVGTIALIGLIIYFDTQIIKLIHKTSNNINKYLISGLMGMIIYQQIQSIGMNIGLLPITGITFPFISYGGSSLLSYMIIAGLLFNISNESIRYTNKKI